VSIGPDDDGQDIDPADLDDLGDLGDAEQDEDEGKDDGEQEYTPPSKEDYDRLQRKIRRQEDRITRLTGKGPKGKASATVDDQLKKQLDSGREEPDEDDDSESKRWRGIAIQNAAASQIAAAGFSGTAKQAARLARLIDTSDLTADRDGSFDLEDEIEELKEEYPQLFAQSVGGRRAPRVRTAPVNDTPPKDPSRQTSQAMMRQAGYR